VPRAQLETVFEWFGQTARVVTIFSQGVNQSSSGTDKANSIINVHLATGRIGRPGSGPFSVTGQPNAMGGREVGGFANALAAHMQIEDADHRRIVQQFWRAPRLPERAGLKAVDMFEAMYRGRIKAIWIMATNPVVSLPNADRAREALRRCEFVVVSECTAHTDTSALAHVLLPACAWGEKDGTVTNSDRHISRQRAFLASPGEAQPDWWIVCQIAQRMGFADAFAYTRPADIFDEHARLTAAKNDGARALDLGGLAGLSAQAYDALQPVQWPVRAAGQTIPVSPLADGRFYHPDKRARLIAVRPRAPRHTVDEEFPFVLNSGRIRDQWHGMTRTGRAARLCAHLPEPFVDVHAADAQRLRLKADTLVRVVTRWGQAVLRLRSSGEVARGTIFVPIHWSDVNASQARVGALVGPALDPVSGQPEFKHTPARLEPFLAGWYGVAVSRRPLSMQHPVWWACVAGKDSQRYEIAGHGVPLRWARWARALLGAETAADWIDYQDASRGIYHAAYIVGGRLEAALFIAPQTRLPSRAWLGSLLEQEALSSNDRMNLLAGRARDAGPDPGPTVCACLGIGRRAIQTAIASGCTDPAAIGARIGAGTQCGSCIPELRRLLAAAAPTAAA
jgi:assimilatory nitrate reductase catalytic subunit